MNLATLYRRHVNPRARRTSSTGIIHSGQARTVYGCVCGATHTAATRYRRAAHVLAWEAKHAGCMRAALVAAGVLHENRADIASYSSETRATADERERELGIRA